MKQLIGERTIVQACRCQSRFCERCAIAASAAFREKLPQVVSKWKKILFLTLTTDPKLFGSPKEAFEHIRKSRAISRLMRDLRKLGLIGKHYVGVVEWHESGWTHWHIAVDGNYINPKLLQELWAKYRPKSAGKYVPEFCEITGALKRPGLGWVKVRGTLFHSPEHCANYLCKYMTKPPRAGWPQWILDYEGNVHRHLVSKGFWKDAGLAEPKDESKKNIKVRWETPSPRKTIAERIRRCGDTCIVRRVLETISPESGGEVQSRSVCYGRVGLSWRDLLLVAGRTDEGGGRSMEISSLFGQELLERFPSKRITWVGNPKWIGPPARHVGHCGKADTLAGQLSLILDSGELVSYGTNYF